MAAEKQRVVLPVSVTPVHYDIEIDTDFQAFTFTGVVHIDVTVHEATDSVKLNASDMDVQKASVEQAGAVIAATGITLHAEDETVVLALPGLQPGPARLTLTYVGNLNDQMKGYYRSQYKATGTDEPRLMGSTQFEPVDARRAFPCWDEPAHKATFSVALVVPSGLVAISNMPEVSREDRGATYRVAFDKTPKMSTYLLAWVIGDLECIEKTIPKTHDKSQTTLVRVFTVKGRVEEGRFALDIASRTLPYYEQYFESDYPLPKADLIAIPDFAAGAMENWGLVTYRETCLLCTEKSSSFSRQRITVVIAHELAHQWFGNLVTMAWWRELWLNEGFANFIEYVAADHLFPEWKIWTQFVNDELGRALELDALENSHPIEVEIYHAQEIDEIFDHISYAKGSVVVRMIQSFVGPETFRTALSKYLAHFSHRNATTKDLWDFLARESGRPVAEIMDCWTSKQGYPVLTVESAGSGQLAFSQRQFLAGGQEPKDGTVWIVPLLVRSSVSADASPELLSQQTGTIAYPADAKWVKLNADQTAAVRIKYSDDLLARLTAAVEANELNPIDRLGIIKDTEALATAGLQSSTSLLAFLRVFSQEEDYTVWSAVAQSLGAVGHLLEDDAAVSPRFSKFAAGLLEKKGAELGWDAVGDHLTNMLRALVLAQLVRYEHQPTLEEARKRFDAYVSTNEPPPADLRGAIYSAAVSQGGAAEWNQVKKWYLEATDAEEKVRCLRVLAKARDPALLSDTLEFALSADVRSQDAVFCIESVAANPRGLDLAIEFLKSRWTQLKEKYGAGFMLSRLVKLVEHVTTEEKAKAVEAWWDTIRDVIVERSIRQAIEAARSAAKWKARDASAIAKWLEEAGY